MAEESKIVTLSWGWTLVFAILGAVGSLASVIGLGISVYVLRKEEVIEHDIVALRDEEAERYRRLD